MDKTIKELLINNDLYDKYSSKSLILAFRDLWRVWNKAQFARNYASLETYNASFDYLFDHKVYKPISLFGFNDATEEQFDELIKLTEKYEKLAAFA